MTMAQYLMRVAGDITFLPPKETKPAKAYVRLVEDRGRYGADGKWESADPHWHEGEFTGSWAEALHRGYQKGDNLVIVGDLDIDQTEKDGRRYVNSRVRAQAFGPNPILTRLTIDRTPRNPNTQQQVDQTQAQQQQAPPAANAEPAPAAGADSYEQAERNQEYQTLLGERARQLLTTGRISQVTFEHLGANLYDDPTAWAHSVERVLDAGGVEQAEKHYLTSVVDEYAGRGPALDWEQAEARSAQEAAPAHQTPQPVPAPAPAPAQRM